MPRPKARRPMMRLMVPTPWMTTTTSHGMAKTVAHTAMYARL
jgi:hypothetical protein